MKQIITFSLIIGLLGGGYVWSADTWTTLNYPGAITTQILGIDGNTLVGYYEKDHWRGLIYEIDSQIWTTIEKPGSNWTIVDGVSGSNLVGRFSDGVSVYSFLYNLSTQSWKTLNAPGTSNQRWTMIYGIDGNNVVGQYYDGAKYHGIHYNILNNTWTILDMPGANSTSIEGIDGDNLVGQYTDTSNKTHGFLYNMSNQIWTTLDKQGAYYTIANDIDENKIVGSYLAGVGYGFVYDRTTWSTVSFPGATQTSITGIDRNKVVGYYRDSSSFMHGFLYNIASVSILFPNGGEIFHVGTTKTITWESEGEITNVQLSYSSDNGSTWNVIKTVANTGSTTWTIPNTLSSECLLKISDADNPDIFDISDAPFTIQPAYPILTSPNGGEQLYTSTERTIYWNTVGAISTVLIEYSTDNGLNWTPVDPANVGNTKSYKWKVPHAVSEQCLIRVSNADNPTSYDVSNASFSIVASKPSLIIPNGGENLLTGSDYDIRWSTTGVIQNIAIEYSSDNGSSWQPVSPANTGNTGHYSWTIPYQVSDQCLIRISNADHPEVYDVSELPFQIVSSLPALLSPNGGEQLLSGTTIPIQWNTTGSISDILIEYSVDNGNSWITVTPPNTGNTGTYDWAVPYTMSKECLIRVSDASHPVVNDISDAVFEISPLYLKTPNGGEKMLINSLSKIYWDSGETLSGDLINLKYSTNKGQNWTDLGNTENDGLYEWSVPQVESNQYLIQITDVNTPEYSRISQETFVVYRCYEQIAGDLDGDCLVGLSDFAVIAENWLNQGKVLVKNYSMDETPNWTTQGQWEFGQPLGLGGSSYGNPDPNSGYTGINVYGINLSGDYNTAIGDPYYLTTGLIDCSHFEDIKVSFMSWLNIDGSNYAQCKFEVSINGTDWVTLWNNTPEPITDNDWNKMEFDISEYADDNPTLYLRWGYQIIDRAYPYSGWNIDDVELWGTL